MITIEAYLLFLLLGSNAALSAVACFLFARFESRCKRIETFWESTTGSAIAETTGRDSREQMLLTRRLEQRVGELQRTVKVMEIKETKSRTPVERSLPIENALRMAKLGASIDELTKSCGLNIGEARLMQKLHGKATALAAEN